MRHAGRPSDVDAGAGGRDEIAPQALEVARIVVDRPAVRVATAGRLAVGQRVRRSQSSAVEYVAVAVPRPRIVAFCKRRRQTVARFQS